VWDISCRQDAWRGYFGTDIYLSDWVKQFSDKPRIVAGNFLTPVETAAYIAEGHAEAAAMARALISDAQWANKAKMGKAEQIRAYAAEHRSGINEGVDPGAH
jgi:2,4-dienoyl-CoA reductase-like NADH-dependent reductase (Old Yellow Enzyme family)